MKRDSEHNDRKYAQQKFSNPYFSDDGKAHKKSKHDTSPSLKHQKTVVNMSIEGKEEGWEAFLGIMAEARENGLHGQHYDVILKPCYLDHLVKTIDKIADVRRIMTIRTIYIDTFPKEYMDDRMAYILSGIREINVNRPTLDFIVWLARTRFSDLKTVYDVSDGRYIDITEYNNFD
jgi:hypothetical protein